MRILKPPSRLTIDDTYTVFLAGSIEMGLAEAWQDIFADDSLFAETDITFLNPRLDDWDSSWVQSRNNPKFYEQVGWELVGLDTADQIVFYFQPSTQSPVTLLEFGRATSISRRNHGVHVVCPDGFWRKGNVDIACELYDLTMHETLDDAAAAVAKIYNKHATKWEWQRH